MLLVLLLVLVLLVLLLLAPLLFVSLVLVIRYLSGQLRFATVLGAGHLVPAERPQSALALVTAALDSNRQLPPYTGPQCKRLWLGRGYGEFC